MTHQLDADDFFIHRIQEHCAAAGLNFFLVEPVWAEPFLAALETGKVRVRVLLNMHSDHHRPDELFHRIILEAHRRGTDVIDPPHVAMVAFDKGRLHHGLVLAGIPVPFTIVVEQVHLDGFQISEGERAALGSPFVIKPAMGYGRRGLVLNATHEGDLRQSVAAFPDARYLLQRRIIPATAPSGEPLYFRVYYVFGEVWIAWWNCHTDRYRQTTAEDRATFGLDRLDVISRQLARLTGMRFFSTELTLTETNQPMVIDYINDQCHMLTQSADPQRGVPDNLVAQIAKKLVDAVVGILRNTHAAPLLPAQP